MNFLFCSRPAAVRLNGFSDRDEFSQDPVKDRKGAGERGVWFITVTCMKRWGLRASSLSAATNADAGHDVLHNHLNTNVLYMMLWHVFYSVFSYNFIDGLITFSIKSLLELMSRRSTFLNFPFNLKVPSS